MAMTDAPSSPSASSQNHWLGIENRLANKGGNNSMRLGYTFSAPFCRMGHCRRLRFLGWCRRGGRTKRHASQEPELITYLWRIVPPRSSGPYLVWSPWKTGLAR
ncbi:hypothetical protein M404DRAFT_508717 [Pisolithus tinctorius Marx 270]|uniref:Uncharacterized protein n=1 Tax=Pisolithus tinctorius Marx 270 TaxID=870435 RepID=A0A0C3K8N5_PISTI|nr:hypothetical protein M404DRAFT_508717 [Pisolithus tinctorius Marx 270]